MAIMVIHKTQYIPTQLICLEYIIINLLTRADLTADMSGDSNNGMSHLSHLTTHIRRISPTN